MPNLGATDDGTRPRGRLTDAARSRISASALIGVAILLPSAVLMRLPGQIVDQWVLRRWAAIAPFGLFEVVSVHVLAGVALAWTLSEAGIVGWLTKLVSDRGQLVLGLVLIGCGVSLPTLYLGEVSLPGLQIGHFWLRVVWMLALQLPWILAAMMIWPCDEMSKEKTDNPKSPAARWAVIAMAAILLPMAHAKYVTKRESRTATAYIGTEQYVRAWSHLVALEAMAGVQLIGAGRPEAFMSTKSSGGSRSDTVRANLVARIFAEMREASQPLPDDAKLADVMRRATTYMSLDELDRASELLEARDDRRPDALLLLAAIYEEKRDSRRAVEVLEEAVDSIGDAKGDDVEPVIRNLYQRLAQNLRVQQRYGDAESRLLEAVERYGHSHGFFFYELGLHAQLGGRVQTALKYYDQSVKADSRYSDRVAKAVTELQVKTPACVLRTQPRQ